MKTRGNNPHDISTDEKPNLVANLKWHTKSEVYEPVVHSRQKRKQRKVINWDLMRKRIAVVKN